MDDNDNRFWNGWGLLGPSAQTLALRKQYGISPYTDVPSTMARIGLGVTDLIEPVKQTYLNLTDPTAAAAYRQQRTEDERLHEQGLIAGGIHRRTSRSR
jgi:hypothetical protein